MAYMTNREFAEHMFKQEKRNAYTDALAKEVRQLRAEKQEREKGCLYCAGYEADLMLPVIEMDEGTANSLEIDGEFAYIHCHCGRHTVGEINFCPMCGKSLKEVANER